MKRKAIFTASAAAAMILATGITSLAAGWQQNAKGYWYGTNADNTTFYANSWQWIDGNGDGIAECYYFDGNGYMLANTTTPDGYQVNANGAWVQNGQIQTKNTGTAQEIANSVTAADKFVGMWNHESGRNDDYVITKKSDGSFEISGYHNHGTSYTDDKGTGFYDATTGILTCYLVENEVGYRMENGRQVDYSVMNEKIVRLKAVDGKLIEEYEGSFENGRVFLPTDEL